MSRFHFLLSVCAALFVYVCISILFGREGLWTYNQLQNRKITLMRSVEHLQEINARLNSEAAALQKDRSIIAAYAKKLGFVGSGERLVKITGMGEVSAIVYDPGTKAVLQEIIFVPEWISKSIALSFFVVYNLIYSLIIFVRRYDTAKIRPRLS